MQFEIIILFYKSTHTLHTTHTSYEICPLLSIRNVVLTAIDIISRTVGFQLFKNGIIKFTMLIDKLKYGCEFNILHMQVKAT